MVRETSQAEVVLAANHIKTYNPIAYAATEPAPVALDASATANCYVVARAGRYEFDATTMGNGAVTPPDAAYTAGSTCGKADGIVPEALRPVTAKLLWQTAPNLIGEVSLGEEGRIRFTTADPFVEGNAVVAACDADGAILWSWHLWLTSADLEGSLHRYALPYEGLGAAAVMDRNLGALAAAWLGADNVSSYGMFYQGGRKDPFVPFRSSQERMAVYDAAGAELADDSAASAAFDTAPGWHLADGDRLGAAATMEARMRCPMSGRRASTILVRPVTGYRIASSGRPSHRRPMPLSPSGTSRGRASPPTMDWSLRSRIRKSIIRLRACCWGRQVPRALRRTAGMSGVLRLMRRTVRRRVRSCWNRTKENYWDRPIAVAVRRYAA